MKVILSLLYLFIYIDLSDSAEEENLVSDLDAYFMKSMGNPEIFQKLKLRCSGKFTQRTGSCLQETQKKVEKKLEGEFGVIDKSDPHYRALRFCGVIADAGTCILDMLSNLKCPTDELTDRVRRRFKMESKFAIAEVDGMCSGKGLALIEELSEKGIFYKACFQMAMMNIAVCKSEFIEEQSLRYSEQEIDQFETSPKNVKEDCCDIVKLNDCMWMVQDAYEQVGAQCRRRKDIKKMYRKVKKSVVEKYYQFYPECNESFYGVIKAEEQRKPKNVAYQQQVNFIQYLLSIVISCLLAKKIVF